MRLNDEPHTQSTSSMNRSRLRDRRRQQCVQETIRLAEAVQGALQQAAGHGVDHQRHQAWWTAIQAATGTSGGPAECHRLFAQTFAVSASVLLANGDRLLQPPACRWLLQSANPLWQDVLNDVLCCLTETPDLQEPSLTASRSIRDGLKRLHDSVSLTMTSPEDRSDCGDSGLASVDFFESFLAIDDAGHRRRRGVFYTPRPVARWIVARLDELIRNEFGLANGLADPITWSELADRHPKMVVPSGESPDDFFLRLLEPAVGSGVFLDELIGWVHHRFTQGIASGCSRFGTSDWDEYVHRLLLPRLEALEIMLPACVLAHLRVAFRLAQTGYSFRQCQPIGIHLSDTLAGPVEDPQPQFVQRPDRYLKAVHRARRAAFVRPATVILGNPPFSGISQSNGRWISRLLQGGAMTKSPVANYYEVAGQPLGERKVWLQDDYVKFLRFAHWKIEQAGCGLVGLITNHGYLDNPTFRGVRYQLMRTFPRIDVLDLHGNRKKREICPDGTPDANVFDIDQGTAVGFFRRFPEEAPCKLVHRELWGPAQKKLAVLEDESRKSASDWGIDSQQVAQPPSNSSSLRPQSPDFFFVPRDRSRSAEYLRGARLVDVFPLHVTAPVTARDHFVVAFHPDELRQRLAEFCDLSIEDDVVRRHFTNSRSRRYPAGDTRGWRLSEARRQLAADPHWLQRIRRCWYRPFDRRYVIWSRVMIDWPRDEVIGHLLAGSNLALIARRQMLPSQPCNYFWITDDLTLDGVIRSDNRGSESIFPLYTWTTGDDGRMEQQPNLAERFVNDLAEAVGCRPVLGATGDLITTFGALDVLHYIYALFHSDEYRTRYADLLRADFPRVLLPGSRALFAQFSRYGRQLVEAHLLRQPVVPGTDEADDEMGDGTIAAGYPKYDQGQILINRQQALVRVPESVWTFRVGGHQVCRKWLKDRRGRILRSDQRRIYRGMIAAIERTQELTRCIDRSITTLGGWSEAFRETRLDAPS